MQLTLTPGMTGSDWDITQKAEASYEGMAHFADTGPEGKICHDCAHWGAGHKSRPIATRQSGCHKWVELMKAQPKFFPGLTAACRWFEPRPKDEKAA